MPSGSFLLLTTKFCYGAGCQPMIFTYITSVSPTVLLRHNQTPASVLNAFSAPIAASGEEQVQLRRKGSSCSGQGRDSLSDPHPRRWQPSKGLHAFLGDSAGDVGQSSFLGTPTLTSSVPPSGVGHRGLDHTVRSTPPVPPHCSPRACAVALQRANLATAPALRSQGRS